MPLTLTLSRPPPQHTLVTPGLVPPFRTYRENFASKDTNPFTDNFAAFMAPYALDPANAAASNEPAALARKVYSSTMSGDPMAFLLCHPTLGFDSGNNPGRLGLILSIIRYDACIGRPASPWDDKAFGTRGDVVMGSVSCDRWLPAYMRQTSTVVALTAGAMDSALAGDVDAPLFGPYAMGDAECEQVKTRYAVYVPPPLGRPSSRPRFDGKSGLGPSKRGDY